MSERGDEDGTLMIHPGYQFGAVCVGSSRVTASTVAGSVFAGDSVDSVAEDYDLTRLQVLTACWWWVQRAVESSRHTKAQTRLIDVWGQWASDAGWRLGGYSSEPCADPPPATRALETKE